MLRTCRHVSIWDFNEVLFTLLKSQRVFKKGCHWILLLKCHSSKVSSFLRNLLTKPDSFRDAFLPVICLEHDMSIIIFLRLFLFYDHLFVLRSFLLDFDLIFLSFLSFFYDLDFTLFLFFIYHFLLLYSNLSAFIDFYFIISLFILLCLLFSTFLNSLWLKLTLSPFSLIFWLFCLRFLLDSFDYWVSFSFLNRFLHLCNNLYLLRLLQLQAVSDLLEIFLKFALTLTLKIQAFK